MLPPGSDMARPGMMPAAGAADPSGGRGPLRVLVVDDSESSRLIASAMLKRLGQKPDLAPNGAEAVAAVQRRPYDIILMDCQMPGMDGIEAARRIRAAEPPDGTGVPILAMTSSALPEEKAQCMAAGMNDILPKPVALKDLASALARWRRQPGRPAPAASPVPGVETPALLDLSRIQQLRELSREHAPGLLGELVESFLREVPGRLRQLRDAVERGDREAFRVLAHGLAGVSGNVGALRLMSAARALQAPGGADLRADGADALGRLEEEFLAASGALRRLVDTEPGTLQ